MLHIDFISLKFSQSNVFKLIYRTKYDTIIPYSGYGKEDYRAHDRTETRVLHTGGGCRDTQHETGQCNKVVEARGNAWLQGWQSLADQQSGIRTVHEDSEERLLQQRKGKLTLPVAESRQRSDDWTRLTKALLYPATMPYYVTRCYAMQRRVHVGAVVFTRKGNAMHTITPGGATRLHICPINRHWRFALYKRPICKLCHQPSSRLALAHGKQLCVEHFSEVREAIEQALLTDALDRHYSEWVPSAPRGGEV